MRTTFAALNVLMLGALAAIPARGQDGDLDSLQTVALPRLLQEALQNNPQIKSAESRWQAARERPAQVSALPDPMAAYSRWLQSVETRVGPQENVFMLSQRIPFPGKLGLRGDMAREDAVAGEQRYQATRRDVEYNVKTSYYDLYWIDQSLQILDDYLLLLRDFASVAETRYATGSGIQANVLKAQVEISNIMERRLGFEKLRSGVVARLNALLARPADRPLGRAAGLDTSRVRASEADLIAEADKYRQELLESEAMIRKSEAARRLAKKDYLPDFNLQAMYITIPKVPSMFTDAGKDAYSVQVGVNLPIWFGKQRAGVHEAEATLAANRLAYENTQNKVSAEITDHYLQLATSARTLDLYEQGLLTQAESSLQSALSAYKTGKLDFLNLLDAERALLQFRLGYIKELTSYRKQAASLERAVGGELPR